MSQAGYRRRFLAVLARRQQDAEAAARGGAPRRSVNDLRRTCARRSVAWRHCLRPAPRGGGAGRTPRPRSKRSSRPPATRVLAEEGPRGGAGRDVRELGRRRRRVARFRSRRGRGHRHSVERYLTQAALTRPWTRTRTSRVTLLTRTGEGLDGRSSRLAVLERMDSPTRFVRRAAGRVEEEWTDCATWVHACARKVVSLMV